MIKFTEKEKEILKEEFEDQINCMMEGIAKEGDNFFNSRDTSVTNSLFMSKYLLDNIDNLEDEFNFKMLKYYFIIDIWNAVDENVQNKVYSKEENELYNKIINYTPQYCLWVDYKEFDIKSYKGVVINNDKGEEIVRVNTGSIELDEKRAFKELDKIINFDVNIRYSSSYDNYIMDIEYENDPEFRTEVDKEYKELTSEEE